MNPHSILWNFFIPRCLWYHNFKFAVKGNKNSFGGPENPYSNTSESSFDWLTVNFKGYGPLWCHRGRSYTWNCGKNEFSAPRNIHGDTIKSTFRRFTIFEVAAPCNSAGVGVTLRMISKRNPAAWETLFRYDWRQFLLIYNFPGYAPESTRGLNLKTATRYVKYVKISVCGLGDFIF